MRGVVVLPDDQDIIVYTISKLAFTRSYLHFKFYSMLLWLGIALFQFGALGALQQRGETIKTTAATLDIFQNVDVSYREVRVCSTAGTTGFIL